MRTGMHVLEDLQGFASIFRQWLEVVSALRGSSPKDEEKDNDTPSGASPAAKLQEVVVAAKAKGELKLPSVLSERLWHMLLEEKGNEQDWEAWADVVTFRDRGWPSLLPKEDIKEGSAQKAIIELVVDQLRKSDNLSEFRKIMSALHAVREELTPEDFQKDVQDLHMITFVHELSESEVEEANSVRDQLCDVRSDTPSNWAKAPFVLRKTRQNNLQVHGQVWLATDVDTRSISVAMKLRMW